MFCLKEQTRVRLMMMHGLVMLGMGAALLFIRASMVDLFYYILGCAVAVLLVTGSLLFIAILDWICAASMGARQIRALRGLLILSTCAAASCFFLALYPGSSVRLLAYIVALYAFLLSIGKFRLARSWMGTRASQLLMYGLAIVALIFSVTLISVAQLDEREVLAVIAGYSLFVGLQMLVTMANLQYDLETQGTASGSTHAHI